MTKNAAQRRRLTFYEAIKFAMRNHITTIAVTALCITIFSGCGSLPTRTHEVTQPVSMRHEDSKLNSIFNDEIQKHGDDSGFILLRDGDRALQERLALVDIAEHTIDVQYYIWNCDKSAKRIAQRLMQAADRGVAVRMILDDLPVGDRNELLLAANDRPNIDIRVYNPFVNRKGAAKWLSFAFDFKRLNRRMHNKTFTVDKVATIVGGRNIGDEYFNNHEHLNFRDLDLIAVGPVVRQVSQSFQEYWNSPWAVPINQLVAAEIRPEDKGCLDAPSDDRRVSETMTQIREELRYRS